MLRAVMPKRLFYGWYIVFAGAVSNAIMLTMVVFGFGVFIDLFKNEFGWSVTAIAVGFSIRSLESGLLSPFTGFVQDKLGARVTCIMGLVMMGIALLTYAQVRNLPTYYAASALLALGQSLGGFNSYTNAIMRWFNKKRGVAMGVMNIGNGVGYFGPLFIAGLVAALGWREALVAMAVILLVAGIPLAMIIRENPEPYGFAPDGDALPPEGAVGATRPARRPRSDTGMEVKAALKTPAFYLLVLTAAVQGFAHSSWNTLQIPHMKANGFTLEQAGLVLGFYGVGQIAMRFSIGWLGDKFGRKRVYLVSYAGHGSGLLAFAFLSPERMWLLPFYYVLFGMGHGAQNTIGQSIVADYYGAKRFATLRGLRQSMTLPASILAPVFSGLMFDLTGNYRLGFVLLSAISLSGIFFQALIRRPLWDELPEAHPAPAPSPKAAKSPQGL